MSSTEAPSVSKSALRAAALARRAALGSDQRAAAEQAIAVRARAVLSVLKPQVVAGYMPIRSECDPGAILERARASGMAIALPAVVDRERILFRIHEAGELLVPGGFGTLAPGPGAAIADPDLLLVPLVGFDRNGNRLGYGRGYYDRAIAAARAGGKRAPLVGLAFSVQEVEAIPAESHDIRLDWVVTEKETLEFRSKLA
ncbi:MAG: 5-formyltetrahydrofolate cyclo-ligase [Rhizobiales bacterium]|nr:5-formyltetrahydrofolate cyclo-ligase [Hyphomicrobiales bacterium]